MRLRHRFATMWLLTVPAYVLVFGVAAGCQTNGSTPVSDATRQERYAQYRKCFHQLFDPANPYHSSLGMQRACRKYAKERVR